MTTEQAVMLIGGAFGAIKSLEWLWKLFYAKRRDAKYAQRITFELQKRMNDMEINMINQIGARLNAKFKEAIENITSRVEYLERSVAKLQVEDSSIRASLDSMKKALDKQVVKIETQYKIILEAIRGRRK